MIIDDINYINIEVLQNFKHNNANGNNNINQTIIEISTMYYIFKQKP